MTQKEKQKQNNARTSKIEVAVTEKRTKREKCSKSLILMRWAFRMSTINPCPLCLVSAIFVLSVYP